MKATKGSITVEAALIVPVFLCIVISVTFFIKIVYTHELIQHAITETAEEMAAAGYVLHVSGLAELNGELDGNMESRAQVFRNHMETVFESFNSLGGVIDSYETVAGAAENPLDELKNAACLVAGGAYEDLKTLLFTPFVKVGMEKYLAQESNNADERLRALNIQGGFEGLDFSASRFLSDSENDIDIIVKYKITLPVPIKLFSEYTAVQRATVKAWMGGDEASGIIGDGGEDIWALDNLSRGKRVRSLFGANLPFNFPVIAKFEMGRATMIKSMDLTAKSYKDPTNVIDTLEGYLADLDGFKGREEPWGSSGITVREGDIKEKVLLLVIPENPLDPATEQLLAAFEEKARIMGIKPVIERYGIKKLQPQEQD